MKSQVSGFNIPISTKTHTLVPCCIPEAESSVKTAHIPCMGWHKLPVVFPLSMPLCQAQPSGSFHPQSLVLSLPAGGCSKAGRGSQQKASVPDTSLLIWPLRAISSRLPAASGDLFGENMPWVPYAPIFVRSAASTGTIPTSLRPGRLLFPLSLKNPAEILNLMGSCMWTFCPGLSCRLFSSSSLVFIPTRGFLGLLMLADQ